MTAARPPLYHAPMPAAPPDLSTLTAREKETLRLLLDGHDAKSAARALGLSVHTVNERLRDARRKMAVSSSREAARLLLEAEGVGAPDFVGDSALGEEADRAPTQMGAASPPRGAGGRAIRTRPFIIGAILMTIILGLLALSGALPVAPAPRAPVSQASPDPAVVDAAQRFLELVDRGDWDGSYRATGAAFRKLNTARVWSDVSQRVRVPLGAVVSRTFASQQELPAPPAGYQVVKFATRFANKAEAVETVSLEREGEAWRVVGVTIE